MELPSVSLCLALVLSGASVHGGDQKPSKNLLTFLNLLNGYFTNQAQVKFESKNQHLAPHISYTIQFTPVLVKGLEDNITFIFEDTFSGQRGRQRLWIISEDCYGVIYVLTTPILGFGPEKPCNSDDVSHTQYIDIRFEPNNNNRTECLSAFYLVDPNVYTGTVTSCSGGENIEIRKYSMTVTCHSLNVFGQSLGFVGCLEPFMGKPQLPTILYKNTSYNEPLPHQFTKGVNYISPCHYK